MNSIPIYAQLQQDIHNALRAQHPEWLLPNGDCPTCDSYDARFAELLTQLVLADAAGLKQGNMHPFQNDFENVSSNWFTA
jgi:hypothetical protein